MTVDENHPFIANSARGLGVRPGSGPTDDIPVNEAGEVVPNSGGMSVAPGWRDLPYFRIPSRLADEARGKDEDACWSMGEGPFQNDNLSDGLSLRVDSATHALVEPHARMPLHDYLTHLVATRDQWVIDES